LFLRGTMLAMAGDQLRFPTVFPATRLNQPSYIDTCRSERRETKTAGAERETVPVSCMRMVRLSSCWVASPAPRGSATAPCPCSDCQACGRTPAAGVAGGSPHARISDTAHKIAGECSPGSRPPPKIGRTPARVTAHPPPPDRRLRLTPQPAVARPTGQGTADASERRLAPGSRPTRAPSTHLSRRPAGASEDSIGISGHWRSSCGARPGPTGPAAVRVVADTRAIYVRSGLRCAVAHVATAGPRPCNAPSGRFSHEGPRVCRFRHRSQPRPR
jgi:hypothetical protein